MARPQIAQMPLEHGGARTHKPGRIIVHAMGEYIERGERDVSARDLLDELGLSAHALVTPSGVVIRCRDDEQVAWHARGYNTGSLGVEFLVPGVHTYATFVAAIGRKYVSADQFDAGRQLIAGWMDAHGIGPEGIYRHSDLDAPRKLDPGDGFPWVELMKALPAGAP